MARLKGGSHVAGDMTIEGVLTVPVFRIDETRTIIFSGAGDLTTDRIPRAKSLNELIDGSITDSGTLVTVDVPTKINSTLEVTGDIWGASIYLEEDGNSGNGLRLFNDSGLTADKTLTFNVNDASRTLSLLASIELDQSVRTTDTPTFSRVISTISTGTAPFTVASTTKVTNLNADLLDGFSEASFFKLTDDETVTGRPNFNGGITGSIPPFYVDSTFEVTNLNAEIWAGAGKTVSTALPTSGDGVDGDIWFVYIP